jgi:fatty-acyl-CoA synthase
MYKVALSDSHFPAQTDDNLRETTVGGVLESSARRWPDTPALVEAKPDGSMGRGWTFRQLHEDAERLALALASRFASGERIAVWSPNSPEWAILEFAAARAGLTLVTVNPSYQAKELRYVLAQSRTAGLFLVREFHGNPMADIARQACADLPGLRHVIDLDDADTLFAHEGSPRPLPRVDSGDAAQIQYTSGTTGLPKGALLSHRALTNNARFVLARMGARERDTYLNVMPMFHVSGCSAGLLGSVQWGCRLIMVKEKFDPTITNTIITHERANLMFAAPTMLIGMLEAHERNPRDMSSLRIIMAGGAMVPPELVRSVEREFGCPLAIVYGQTETSGGLTQARLVDSLEDRIETCGQAHPQTELSIRNVSTNAAVQVGTVGEICARGYCKMIGYNDNPKATAETIDSEGWLHTGDLGTMDSRGYLRVTGRLKEMIIRGGENLFPVEIENVLIEHPAIAEVAVVGVPDPKWGEIAVCFLRVQGGSVPAKGDLIGHLRRDLAAPKTPAHWIVVESFPLTTSGKIQKFVLRERYIAGDFIDQILL